MNDQSIYRYMDLGIVHFKAFPECVNGTGPIVETMKKIVEDDFWTAIEIGTIKDDKKRSEVRSLLEISDLKVCYACQPRILPQKLNLNSSDEKERRRAIEGVKKGIAEAYHLGATSIRILSGKDPGAEKREDEKKIFVDSLMELCEFNESFGDAMLYLKIFDRDIDKKALIGEFKDAADVSEPVAAKYKSFGVLADLSHFPLLDEKPEDAIPLVEKFPMHFHLGNCIMRDRKHPLYGDLQPRFGIPGGETGEAEVRDYFKLLLDRGLLSQEKKPVVSVEVRPLLMEEYSEAIIAQAKRVIKKAWANI